MGLRGPGETQIESDRREIRRKISHLESLLETVRGHRGHARGQRRRREIPVVALVGYTNAGKSSLLNALSGAAVGARNELFATLDPTTRRIRLPRGKTVLLSDTVGFIQKLPHSVIAAFRATMEEILEAEVVVVVADAADPHAGAQLQSVRTTLHEIGLENSVVVTAWNKTDKPGAASGVATPEHLGGVEVRVSARRGDGLAELLARIEEQLQATMEEIDVIVPYLRGDLVNEIHQIGTVDIEEHRAAGTRLRAHVPHSLAERVRRVTGSMASA